MTKDANNPAFPTVVPDGNGYTLNGLTKRELFAAMAMQGLLAGPHAADLHVDMIASDARLFADALLAELNKPTKGAPHA